MNQKYAMALRQQAESRSHFPELITQDELEREVTSSLPMQRTVRNDNKKALEVKSHAPDRSSTMDSEPAVET